MKITKKDIRYMVNESIKQLLSEAQIVVDNFDKIEQLLDISSPDDFFFVQIIQRKKRQPYFRYKNWKLSCRWLVS